LDLRFDDLIKLTTTHAEWASSGVSPRQALYIAFTEQVSKPANTIVYETAVGGSMVVEFDEHGLVLGIEFT
jgi:hypothetical protein